MARNQDNDGGNLLVGGLFGLAIGAASSSLSPEDKAALADFKANQHLFNSFKFLLPSFENYLRNKQLIDIELNQLKEKEKTKAQLLKVIQDFGLKDNLELKSYIDEPGTLIINGHSRAGAMICLINLETLLKKKINGPNLAGVIDNAKKEGLIDEKDRNYLHGLRGDRNDLAHEIPSGFSQSDAIHIFMLAMKITSKVYTAPHKPQA